MKAIIEFSKGPSLLKRSCMPSSLMTPVGPEVPFKIIPSTWVSSWRQLETLCATPSANASFLLFVGFSPISAHLSQCCWTLPHSSSRISSSCFFYSTHIAKDWRLVWLPRLLGWTSHREFGPFSVGGSQLDVNNNRANIHNETLSFWVNRLNITVSRAATEFKLRNICHKQMNNSTKSKVVCIFRDVVMMY